MAGIMDYQKYFDLLIKGQKLQAELLRQEDIPQKLIKFVALDGSEGDQKKFASLENRSLWFSKPAMYNDPYEFKGMFLDRKKFKDASYPDSVIDMYELLFDYSYMNPSIVCLSGTDIGYLPMWAYYANNSRGFCIEYDVVKKDCIHRVSYEGHRVKIASILMNMTKTLQDAMKTGNFSKAEAVSRIFLENLYIKSKDWEHEKEYRIVRPDIPDPGKNIPIDQLGMRTSRVIAGIRCSDEDKERLNIISNEIGCGNISCAQLSTDNYGIELIPYCT